MKFSQLIEYNMRNIFLNNHAQTVVEKLVTDPFIKKLKLCISLDQHSNKKHCNVCFYCMSKWRSTKNY